MIWTALILLLAIAFARFVVPVPAPYRILATVNFVFFGLLAVAFSMLTGNAERGVDALKFYERGPVAWAMGFESVFQADFMYFLSGAIQSAAPISYPAFNLIGALFMSYVGVAMLMRLNPTPGKRALLAWWVFTLLPGVHFWHATFGKEALQLLAIGCFFGFTSLYLRLGSLVVLLLVRPHIGLLVAVAEVIRIMLSRKKVSDVVVLTAAFVVCVSAITYLVERLGGSGASIDVLFDLFADYGENWRTSALRLNDTSSPLAYPDFFLRPYPLEIQSFAQLVVFVENILLVVLIGVAIYFRPNEKKSFTAWLFLVFLCVLLPLINPNVGTAARKKQIIPVCAMIILTMPTRRRKIHRQEDTPMLMQGGQA